MIFNLILSSNTLKIRDASLLSIQIAYAQPTEQGLLDYGFTYDDGFSNENESYYY
ncbi:MAG: hypothetical protein ACOCWM_00625 [Cyclobacteriaceae bacterium]